MSFVPPILARNWRLKLSSFGLAVFLWLWAVIGSAPGSSSRFMSIPVTVEVSDSGWAALGPPEPAAVEVHFVGSEAVARALGGGRTWIRIPIDEVVARDTVVQIDRSWILSDLQPSFVVNEITPPQVRITFEERRAVAVPLAIRVSGGLREDLALAQELAVNPVVVSVSGPESRVTALDSLPTQPLDLAGLRGSGDHRVGLDTTGLGDLTFSLYTASVSVQLEEAVEETLPAVPVHFEGSDGESPPAGFTVEPPEVQITLRGGRSGVTQALNRSVRVSVALEWLAALEPGEVRVVPLTLEGVPPLVEAVAFPDSARIRRAAVGDDGGDSVRVGGL